MSMIGNPKDDFFFSSSMLMDAGALVDATIGLLAEGRIDLKVDAMTDMIRLDIGPLLTEELVAADENEAASADNVGVTIFSDTVADIIDNDDGISVVMPLLVEKSVMMEVAFTTDVDDIAKRFEELEMITMLLSTEAVNTEVGSIGVMIVVDMTVGEEVTSAVDELLIGEVDDIIGARTEEKIYAIPEDGALGEFVAEADTETV